MDIQTQEAGARRVGRMAVMGENGDTPYEWDRDNPADVAIARRTFNSFIAKGYKAYRMTSGAEEKGEPMDEFDPDVERIIFCPQMVGG